MEAASDARYIRDALQKMLRCPVFLDSSSLADLRTLFTDGVHQSDCTVLLVTKNVLTRPWCACRTLPKSGAKRVGWEVLPCPFSHQTSFARACPNPH